MLINTLINNSTLYDSPIIVTGLLSFTVLVFLVSMIPMVYSYYRIVSLIITFYPVFLGLYLWYIYDSSIGGFQVVYSIEGIHLSFGIDAVGLSLFILTTILFPICVILMRTYTGINTFLLLEIVILGSLTVLDILGFYILFEASLILLFLLIARTPYGSIDAAYKIVLYTMGGSLLFLPSIFMLYTECGSTNLLLLTCLLDSNNVNYTYTNNPLLTLHRSYLLGWGMFIVFIVKIPLMPVHLWLPEAHVAAPTAGSVLLAGILLKLGGIGIIRFMIPIVPSFTVWISPLISILTLSSFLYSTLSTIRQIDLKKIVAYSSIAHMSLITLTIFSLSEYSIYNSTFMMIAHGLVSPGLFLLVGYVYERFHTKSLLYYSGIGTYMPLFSILFFLLTCANISFPLFPNFVAEVLCLVSIFAIHPLYAYIFCVCQVLGAIYAFWAFNRIIHGYPLKTYNSKSIITGYTSTNHASIYTIADLSRFEFAVITPLLIGIIVLGLKPVF
uniref:NADH-ubiquinone oxidoreductase chain 4 n=1 Tax=Haematococcus lacustris TaxID=44745 RepID=A0A5B9RCX0_HAELA|nr:NADH dehydrogenase subunit 4 [Haematococcus lacustris]QEG54845.1 NADH dehydrogenase subunit 4 [Haematococcus lacustris]